MSYRHITDYSMCKQKNVILGQLLKKNNYIAIFTVTCPLSMTVSNVFSVY